MEQSMDQTDLMEEEDLDEQQPVIVQEESDSSFGQQQ